MYRSTSQTRAWIKRKTRLNIVNHGARPSTSSLVAAPPVNFTKRRRKSFPSSSYTIISLYTLLSCISSHSSQLKPCIYLGQYFFPHLILQPFQLQEMQQACGVGTPCPSGTVKEIGSFVEEGLGTSPTATVGEVKTSVGVAAGAPRAIVAKNAVAR